MRIKISQDLKYVTRRCLHDLNGYRFIVLMPEMLMILGKTLMYNTRIA